jgi:4-hydroxy-3-methylbut-2-en-1-yl diphosphate synthase IspG/GcpE
MTTINLGPPRTRPRRRSRQVLVGADIRIGVNTGSLDARQPAERVTAASDGFETPLRVAVMGCVVKKVLESEIVETPLEEAMKRDWI